MQLKQRGVAGTFESSDCHVEISPSDTSQIQLQLKSDVMSQYGETIREVILETLRELGISSCRISVDDKGALDCTLRSRVQTAAFRSAGQAEQIPWGSQS